MPMIQLVQEGPVIDYSANDQANGQVHRVRAVLGVRCGELPRVTRRLLAKYYEYLRSALRFPFEAKFPWAVSSLRTVSAAATVTALVDPTEMVDAEELGLVCRALHADQDVVIPLADLELRDGHDNHQLIEDYWYWFWNWRFEPRI